MPSSSTRRILGCIGAGISAISSSSRVPLSAISKKPWRAPTAPVKAPRSWPKSSLSVMPSAMAAALTATNGWRARAESWWMVRAASSLPVPLAPVRMAEAELAARVSITR